MAIPKTLAFQEDLLCPLLTLWFDKKLNENLNPLTSEWLTQFCLQIPLLQIQLALRNPKEVGHSIKYPGANITIPFISFRTRGYLHQIESYNFFA
jgi:hypothetical protein